MVVFKRHGFDSENISKLKEFGILKRIGSDRKGYWMIVNKSKKED